MKGCSYVFIIAFLLFPQIYAAGVKTLFDENDEVIVYKESDYQKGLYDGVKAHTFLLYSSWCGHCQKFAPVYKDLAEAIKGWSSTVLVTGVDCVYDVSVCRLYNVRGYPTIRFIGPTTNTSDTGITYDGNRAKDAIIEWIANKLAEVQNPPASWPNLHPLTESEATAYTSTSAVSRPKIILFVDNEKEGRKTMLDLQSNEIRFALVNSTAAAVLGAKSPGIGVFSKNGKISHIANVESGAADLEASIRQIIGNETSSNTEFEVEDGGRNQDGLDFVDTSLQYNVYELDMQSAINTALYMEVGLKTEFTEKELEDLNNFISVVRRCGSWTLDYKKQLGRIKKGLDKATTLTNTDWVAVMEDAADAGFPRNSTFLGCKGSKPTTRGYTCGLWILFHTMLTSCYKASPGSVSVLRAIHGYVDSFFTCSYCRNHFLSMSEQMRLLSITDDQTAILAFWEAHNQVNHRLSTEVHDPYFPKVQFPPRSLCAKCSDDAGQFDSDQVFGFLMKHYRRVETPFGNTRLVEGNETVQSNIAVAYKTRSAHNVRHASDSQGFYSFVLFMFCAAAAFALFILLKRKLRIFNCRRNPIIRC